MEEFGKDITALVNLILLSIVYFFGVGSSALVAKLKKKHFLNLTIDRARKSYYEDLSLSKESRERYYRQF